MSFSALVKDELCALKFEDDCCVLAEAYGALIFGSVFAPSQIRIITGHAAFAGRIQRLCRQSFGVDFDECRQDKAGRAVLTLFSEDKLGIIHEKLGYGSRPEPSLHLNRAVIDDECCAASFLRGAFLSCGYISAPEKSYHLSFTTTHHVLSRELCSFLLDSGWTPLSLSRGGKISVYFKFSESIEEILSTMGAGGSALNIMGAKVYRDVRNQINRRVNCETANVLKTANASLSQADAIRRLMDSERWSALPESLKKTAEARLLYPEDSLSQLAERLSIGKSGLNHRLRKLLAYASYPQ